MIISGVVGFYGQKLVYRLMALIVDNELGMERLGPEREKLIEQAEKLAATVPVLEAEDVRDWRASGTGSKSCPGHGTAQLTTPSVIGPSQPEPGTQRARSAAVFAGRRVNNSVIRALTPQRRPDPEKEKDGILNAVNRLVREGGFLDLANPGGLTPPNWLEPVSRKDPASRTLREAIVSEPLDSGRTDDGRGAGPGRSADRGRRGFFEPGAVGEPAARAGPLGLAVLGSRPSPRSPRTITSAFTR